MRILGQLRVGNENLKSQPLLVPLSLSLSPIQMQAAEHHRNLLIKLGIDIKPRGADSLMVMGVPQPLRQQNLQQLLPDRYLTPLNCQRLNKTHICHSCLLVDKSSCISQK